MVEVTDLTKSFNGTTVLDIDRLTIADGDFVGLLGNNGAGKTTLFRLMFDLLRPDTGAVTIDGVSVAGTEPWKAHSGVYLDSSFLIDYLKDDKEFGTENPFPVVPVSSKYFSESGDGYKGGVVPFYTYII